VLAQQELCVGQSARQHQLLQQVRLLQNNRFLQFCLLHGVLRVCTSGLHVGCLLSMNAALSKALDNISYFNKCACYV
jgi:hypothetical protein